ncbi:tyrosine-type recombinase/integrase [Leptospira sp. 2 VSF19]|uniref:Tyrosine-type recombinase/integrase n=1 Tax=Leptospira soteropolitanensis TaxID=2950025 RepID=A0AAW5VJP2_9LEPT|nr:tyrosine-type recombinase/integrase [Leptospira soteropolitanensis]MCW7491971.1 tyrosine-type recombinase/integrase [Leptospira soteropolitanensis]MCW7499554.1 tyrosine-type recombinase/integrase [Leptospira soteropolitanensis]MCW7521805.1 tyrosine-type recombinase/integrase [Leptospira soteropolitanensis]MCW7525658.1 tyrosine-type recombinase/integrase [Leptospira soteropolitanensis]MCW7530227.1 tyrosine-type recombinase/integrase [Leptospira soteropolitanensis]
MVTIENISKQLRISSQGLPEAYRATVRQYLDFEAREGLKLSPEAIRRFLSQPKLRGEGSYSPASIALRKTAIFQAIKRMTFDSRVRASLTEEAKTIKVAKIDRAIHSEKILSEEEIKILIKRTLTINAKGWSQGNKRERYSLTIETLAVTGLRISELIHIRLKDCKKVGGFVYISVMGKGRKPRRVFIPEKLFKKIKQEFSSKEFLFTSLRGKKYNRAMIFQDVRDLGRRILGRDVNPHQFRHSFSTREIKKRGSVKAVQLYLGHASSSITEQMYNHDEIKPQELFG